MPEPHSAPRLTTAPQKTALHLPYLDALRCLSILLVIILHATVPFLVNPALYGTKSWYLCLLQNPFNRIGVPLFFMISGFLILRNPATAQAAPFYRRHIPRLLLPLAAWNGIYYLVHTLSDGGRPQPSEYLRLLLTRGSSYHMWFVYTILGMYLLAPFLRLIVEKAPRNQLLLLLGIILFPSALLPMVNQFLSFDLILFTPMLEGLLGYFLAGYLLGTSSLGRKGRMAVYCGGVLGYLMDLLADLLSASPQAVPLPSESGYRLSHYLLAAAVFLFVRTLWEKHASALTPAEGWLTRLSQYVFGVYWVHALILSVLGKLLGADQSVLSLLALQIPLTAALSLLFTAVVSAVPILRTLLT